MSANLAPYNNALPACEHACACGPCDELDRADCNFYEPKVDRGWLMAVARVMADPTDWETNADREHAMDLARQVVHALGLEAYQVFDE